MAIEKKSGGKKVDVVVARAGYVYRGQSIPKGRVLRMDESQLERAERVNPPYFRRATADEVKRAHSVLDLSTVEPPAPAPSVVAAREAAEGGAKG